MNIAFFVTEFPSVTETFIANQIIALKKRGNQIKIYAQSRGKEVIVHGKVVENALLADTIYLDELPLNRLDKVLFLLKEILVGFSFVKFILFIKFLRRASGLGLSVYNLAPFINTSYDVVHAHFGINGCYVAKLRIAGLFPMSRFVTTFHGYDLEPSVASAGYYPQLFREGHVFTVNSNFAEQKLMLLGCPVEKLVRLPVGLDTDYFNSNECGIAKRNLFTILFVGRLVQVKGPDIFIGICRELKRRNMLRFRAILVGEGEERETLSAAIHACNLQDEVMLVGARTQEEIKTYMAESDVFILPGRTINGRAETQGLVIQEAQAMGLPVIVSEAGGMKEGVVNGITGFILPENNIIAFVEKIELLANDVRLKRRMGESGRKFVEMKYDSRVLNKKLLLLYSSV